MILYFSAGTEKEYFRACQEAGLIRSSFQAQKFNQMIIEGLGAFTDIYAVGNLPYAMDHKQAIPEFKKTVDRIQYDGLSCAPGKLRKLHNLFSSIRIGYSVCKENAVDGIVCDSVNPLASLCTRFLGLLFRLPTVAIVTDIPSIMSEHPSVFMRFANRLMHTFDGYVLLTEAMNAMVNTHNRPYIVMEGLCDISENDCEDALPAREKFCLYTGSLATGTGIETLISAFTENSPDGYSLKIYGGGQMEKELLEHCPAGVFFGGSLTNRECVALQKKASLLINPRPIGLRFAAYSFPSKIMEYMVSGTPVLTTRLPGIPDEYLDYLYTCEDTVDGISKAIHEVLAIPEPERLEKGRRARQFVLEKKNNQFQAKRIMDLVRNCSHKER